MKAKSGFTLVEILIVVVILGILAAIVIPQFSEASTEARTNSLCADLQTIRSQIQLYKIQHSDTLPGTVTGVDFEASMTGYTDFDGEVWVATSTGTKYGRYLQSIPENPFTGGYGVNGAHSDGSVQGWTFITAVGTTEGNFNASDAAHSGL